MSTRVITTPADFDGFVDEILSILPQQPTAHVLALSGELGAGKTTFTQTLAGKLGVVESVVSPTFVIMKRYQTAHPVWQQLVHIDAYRVEDEAEVSVLHLDELLAEPDTIVCIEWPENIPHAIPKNAIRISFTVNDDETRTITYA